ncbi:SH3 domain-containing protein [Stutzerimonas sp. NM35]
MTEKKKKQHNPNKGVRQKFGGTTSIDDLLEKIAALTRPSALTDFQDQFDKLARPSALTDLHEQFEKLTRPSALTDLHEQYEKLTRPSALTDLHEQFEKLTRPSALTDLHEQFEKLTRPSALTDLQDQLDKLTRPSYLEDFQARMDELTRPSYLTGFQAQMAELTRPSYLDELQQQFADISGSARIQTELAVVAGSYQELLSGSVLASYLASPDSFGESGAKVQRVARFDSLDVGDFAGLEVDPVRSADLQIVQAISDGEVAKLSPTAMQRLHSVYVQVLVYWDMLLRIFNTYMAYAFLTALMSGASAPADVHERAALLSNEQRVLLADVRMVNREGANLRAEPTTQSKSIASLPFAHPVEVLEYNDKGWYRVEAETPDGYLEGWMYVSVTTPVPRPKRLRGQKVDVETL